MISATIEIPALQPRSLMINPPLTDEEFERLCLASEAFLERTKEGTIIVNAPAGSETSDGNREITTQLSIWWKSHKRGRAYDATAGFFLPDGSTLNPDASYITAEQLKRLKRGERARFLRLAPAFVIELLSASDRLSEARKKMESWTANGVQLGWLVDPYAKQMHIYTPGAAPRIETGSAVAGSGPVEGFILDLEEVWSCFE
ncbi:MAG TPA: Uma2 family endonuclease [Terracidiphilus sp.]|nr:Uma2 family endonuclease [Terracidiphilus sp.]